MGISDWSSDVCSSDLGVEHELERALCRFDHAVAADALGAAGVAQVIAGVLALEPATHRLIHAAGDLAVRAGTDAEVIAEAPVIEVVGAGVAEIGRAHV